MRPSSSMARAMPCFNRDPHFQRVMPVYAGTVHAGIVHGFNRDPHFQRVMQCH